MVWAVPIESPCSTTGHVATGTDLQLLTWGFQAVVHYSHWRTGRKFSVMANGHLHGFLLDSQQAPGAQKKQLWKVEPSLEFNMEIPEILLTWSTVSDDTGPCFRLTGALLYLSSWFLWDWPLEAHIFEDLVSNGGTVCKRSGGFCLVALRFQKDFH